jgi:hypothetical protein
MQLRTFYFAHPQMYLIPVEHQCDDGISPQFAELLRQERGLGDDFIGLLNSALLTYRARVDVLFRHGRGGWFPPRLQNLCIVTETAASRPFYQPFAGASWLL